MKKTFDKGKLLTFAGGLAASQGLRLTANSNKSQAQNLRREASRQRAAGHTGEANVLESKANKLEQSAARLQKEYERQQALARKKKN